MYKLLPILLFAYGLAMTTEDIYDNSYALIIGISEYQNIPDINYGASDAETIQNLLISQFDFPKENTRLLINDDATKNNIIRAFSDFITLVGENDRFLIYFSGHAATQVVENGVEKGYLMAVDSDPLDLYNSSIGMYEFNMISKLSLAKHILYLVDANWGGISREGNAYNINLDDIIFPDEINNRMKV